MNYRVDGSKLVIEIDISEAAIKAAPQSKSGKTRVVASTNGFVRVSDRLSLGLNLVTK